MSKLDFQYLAATVTVLCLTVGASSAHAQSSNAELATKLSNPIASLISVPFQTNSH